MKMNIKIEFFSPWQCSSGLSAGADADSLVIKDSNGLPYIPGKTLKGLVREAVEDYVALADIKFPIEEAFGKNVDGNLNDQMPQKGKLFFSNATLCKNESEAIVSKGLVDFLYINRTSTSIASNGIAKDHSLRTMESTVPCALYAFVLHVDEDWADIMEKALRFIKCIGTARNRGMGRCRFSVQKGGMA